MILPNVNGHLGFISEMPGSVDMMIAAIAKTRAAAVATRNTSDFRGLDIEIINPCL